MSVVSRNPFDLLGDDGDSSPAPVAPKAAAAPKKTEAPAQRNVPGSAPRGAARGAKYPSRGGPRNVYREDKGPRNTGPDAAEGTTEGLEGAGGFDGERVAPAKRAHNGPDKHTKGPANEARVQTSGGHRARPSGRGAKTPAFGAERRQYERKSGGLPDSQKKVDHGWGANEGTAELTAEVEGEKDAQKEGTAPGTPANEDAAGWGASDAAPAAEAEETPEEPEEVQKSYEQFLAEKAEQALAFGKKEVRQVTNATLEGTAFVREGINDFFSGKEKKAAKPKAEKKEKVYIEVDGQFASPAGGASRPPRREGAERGGRGGRGGARGGDRGGRGRGAPRGGNRGGFGGSRPNQAAIDGSDEKAFPALGA